MRFGWAMAAPMGALLGLLVPDGTGRATAIRVPLFSRSSQFVAHAYGLGDWRLVISRGKFSGDVACGMRSRTGDAVYVADALGFRFGQHLNVLNAGVRIDDGAPYRWRDDLPELARLRVALDGRDLDAPTDGIVWIPAAKLGHANRVTIQPRPDRHPRSFSLRGFAVLREAARRMGCAPEARFVR